MAEAGRDSTGSVSESPGQDRPPKESSSSQYAVKSLALDPPTDKVLEQAALKQEELIEKAQKFQTENACTYMDTDGKYKYRSLCGKDGTPAKLGGYGVGVELYFNFLSQMGFMFLVWACMSCPALVLFLMGNLVPYTGSFVDNLAKTTIANFGACPETGSCDYRERCVTVGHVDGDDSACPMKVNEATEFLGVLEGLALIVFIGFGIFFQLYWIPRRTKVNDDKNLTPADFAVQIDCLPKTLKEGHTVKQYQSRLESHVSEILKTQCDVQESDAIKKVELVCDRNGAIRKFIDLGEMEQALENLQVQKVKADQLGEKGVKKSAKFVKKCSKLEEKIQKNQLGIKSEQENPGIVKAFIMFNKESQKTKLINVYRFGQYTMFRCCQKKELRFEGRSIRVVQAPEPSDLYWENLDTPQWNRRIRLCVTFLITIVLLLVCAFLLVLCQSLAGEDPVAPAGATWVLQPYSETSLTGCVNLCEMNLFTSVGAGCTLVGSSMSSWNTVRFFDKTNEYSTLDFTSACAAGPVWSSPGCSSNGTFTTAMNAWKDAWLGVTFEENMAPNCMEVNQQQYSATELRLFSCGNVTIPSDRTVWNPQDYCEPLSRISTTSEDSGKQMISADATCAVPIPYSVASKTAETDEECTASSVVNCFCMQAVTTYGSELFTGGSDPDLQNARAVCEKWTCQTYWNYTFMGVGALAVLVLNQVLLIIFEYLIDFEHHARLTDKTRAQMWKLFLAQLFNTGFLVLLVNMKVSSGNAILAFIKTLSLNTLLNGEYTDLGVEWYIAVGTGLTITITIQVFSSCLVPLGMSFIFQPLYARAMRGGAATERTMEDLYKLPEWNLALRLAQTLTVFFCILMYSGGMPVLNIVGSLYCLLAYWADKWVLLRGSRTPPMYSEDIIKFVMPFLPVMAMFHTFATCYVFGNQMLFPSDWRTFLGVRDLVFSFLGIPSLHQYNVWRSQYLEGQDEEEGFQHYHITRLADFSRKASYLLTVVLIVGLVYYVLYYLYLFLFKPFLDPVKLILVRLLRTKLASKKEGEDETEKTYKDLVTECEENHRLCSYAMKDNSRYKDAYDAIDGVVEADKKAEAEAEAAEKEATEPAAQNPGPHLEIEQSPKAPEAMEAEVDPSTIDAEEEATEM